MSQRPNPQSRVRLMLRLARELVTLLPPRYRASAVTLLALVVAVAGWRAGTAPDAGATATAILADGSDVNVIVREGRGEIYPISYDREGHGTVLRPVSDLWDKFGHSVGVAPLMGWGLSYMGDVAAGRRGLRYCAAEMAAMPATRAAVVRAILDTYDRSFQVQPSVEDCGRPDLQFGLNPESVTQGCGTPQALGCARPMGGYVRVTIQPSLPVEAQYWIMVHEGKHGGDLGHTGQYGGEGRAHGHCSDMGYADIGVGGANRPVDNTTGKPCVEDWQDGANGHRWGLRPGTPTPTPTPTPSPTPSPTPAAVRAQLWAYVPELTGRCPVAPSGEWCVVTLPAPRAWWRFIDRDGEGTFHEVLP